MMTERSKILYLGFTNYEYFGIPCKLLKTALNLAENYKIDTFAFINVSNGNADPAN